MEENKKKKRRAYLDDFRQTGQGGYEYKGIHYTWKGTKEELKKSMTKTWIYTVVMALCVIGAGCLPVPSMINCVYVILPFTVCFICGISVIWGLCRLTAGGTSLRAYVYDATVEQIPLRAIGTIIGAGGTVAGQLLYLIKYGFQGNLISVLLFLAALIGVILSLILLRNQMKEMNWVRGI